MGLDPDRACEHPDFVAFVEVNRIRADGAPEDSPPVGFSALIRVDCAECGEKFRWVGGGTDRLPYGLRPDGPTVDVSEEELFAPLRPASSDEDFGLGLPFLSIQRGGD